jgi:tRNA A-37 threonylcarbamoyl transferase component Bud32
LNGLKQGVSQVVRGSAQNPVVAELLEVVAYPVYRWFEEQVDIRKQSRNSVVGFLNIANRRYYLKLFVAHTFWQRSFISLGFSRALKSYDKANTLAACGIPVPAPQACLRHRDGIVLVTEALTGGNDMQALWEEDTLAVDQQCWAAAGGLLADLHNASYYHGDYKWSNLLWRAGHFTLLDLEGVRSIIPGSARLYKDIARFTLNAEDMAAPAENYELFLAAYANSRGVSRREVALNTMPYLKQLRSRHEKKYGSRGHVLMQL